MPGLRLEKDNEPRELFKPEDEIRKGVFSAATVTEYKIRDRQKNTGLTREDIQACLAYVSQLLHEEKVYPLLIS